MCVGTDLWSEARWLEQRWRERSGPLGRAASQRVDVVLATIALIRLNRVLAAAGAMLPPDLRSLDAIHLATAQQLGSDLGRIVTYDERMSTAARTLGFTVVAPS